MFWCCSDVSLSATWRRVSRKLFNCLLLASMSLGRSIFMRLRRTKARGNEWRETTGNFRWRHISYRHPIIFGGFGLDVRELNIQDCRIQGSKLERTLTKGEISLNAILQRTTGLLNENFGLSTRLIKCNLSWSMFSCQLKCSMLRSFLSSHSYNLKCEFQCCMLCCRLLTCKVESCMIKLNVSYVENESSQVKLNVVFVTVGCRKVKLKVVW